MSKKTETTTPETDIKSILNHPRNGYGQVVNEEWREIVSATFARQLEQQRDEARKELTTSNARLMELEQVLLKYGHHTAAQERVIAELKADKEALDYLQNGSNGVIYSITNGKKVFIVSSGLYNSYHPEVRQAIKNSIAQTKAKDGGTQ